mgnify:FL=1
MSVGKQVFLLAIVTIPTVMRCMTTASPTVQKAACGRKKSPAVACKKNSCLCRFHPRQQAAIPQVFPNGKKLYPNALNTTRVNSSPFEKIGEKPLFCYYTLAISTEPISFFTGVSRTFFTAEGRFLSVVSSEVMLVMTVVVTVAARRKTCFPTADAVIATKAEPSEDAIGFLYLFLSCPIP